jgi:hypothetical protein
LTFNKNFSEILGLTDDDINFLLKNIYYNNNDNIIKIYEEIKNFFNGFVFNPNMKSIYYTNLVLKAIMNLKTNIEEPYKIENHETNENILQFVASHLSGQQLILQLINGNIIDFNPKEMGKYKTKYIDQYILILFHFGLITYYNNNNNNYQQLTITNNFSLLNLKRIMKNSLPDNDLIPINTKIQNFLIKGEIKPILDFIENSGIYRTTKPEVFENQNEMIPQSIFSVIVDIDFPATKCEYHIVEPKKEKWIDCYSRFGVISQIIEWKNIPLDFVEVPNDNQNENYNISNITSNNLNLFQKKISKLRKMNKNDIY